jgi:arylsulfatase A-like enzyme
MAFTTADFHYAAGVSDEVVVQQAIKHLKADKVRLLRLHLQRIRDDWSGPAGKTNAMSPYVRHIIASDAFLGQLIQTLKDEGVWNDTYLVVTADHGMGQTTASGHPASTASSWDIFMGFYGPGLKKGATIPYAELPDVAVTAAHWLGLTLKGHTSASVPVAKKGPTGTLLTNLVAGMPDEIAHPRYVEQYLKMNTFPGTADMYPAYRAAMLELLK